MNPVNANQMALRDFALRYPETHEDFPWGERVIKVKGKVFLFLGGAPLPGPFPLCGTDPSGDALGDCSRACNS